MAGYQALAAVGRSVVALLNRRFLAEPPGPRRPTAVLVGTGDLGRYNEPGAMIQFPAVSVYCYRLSVDRETRPGWSAVSGSDGVPRLPLRMHLLVSAWDTTAESELESLGLAVSALTAEPVLTIPQLDERGKWRRGDSIQVVPDELALDSMSEAFQALTADFRLCLPYVARSVLIESPRTQEAAEPVASVVAGQTPQGTT
ncbi:DUF4255 domain-containing protein [Streptomyces sp. NPDC087859]|uniref:DUF4255 domain-containing protein n=1 Tax=Streptomyces sp. NPDC087859 TaxID=3365812 RepID=UPI00381D637B